MLPHDRLRVLLNRYVHREGQRYLVGISISDSGILSNNLAPDFLCRDGDRVGSCRRRVPGRGAELRGATAADTG